MVRSSRFAVLLLLRRAVVLGAMGVVIGLPLAWGGRWIASMPYGLPPSDAVTLAGAAILLVLVAAAAGYVPARRATRLRSGDGVEERVGSEVVRAVD